MHCFHNFLTKKEMKNEDHNFIRQLEIKWNRWVRSRLKFDDHN